MRRTGGGSGTATDSAPGGPGRPARWTTAAKTGVGTALSTASSVWCTLSQAILTEVYFPFVDTACTRALGLLVTDRRAFFSEEKRATRSQVSYLAAGVPAYRLVNTCNEGRCRIEKLILADPRRSTVFQQTEFVPLQGELADYTLYVLLAPHLGNQGDGNTAWVGEYKDVPMLFARRDSLALALACSGPWRQRSAGFVGVSDARVVPRPAERVGHAAGVGPRRVRQAAPLPARRPRLRYAASGGACLPAAGRVPAVRGIPVAVPGGPLPAGGVGAGAALPVGAEDGGGAAAACP